MESRWGGDRAAPALAMRSVDGKQALSRNHSNEEQQQPQDPTPQPTPQLAAAAPPGPAQPSLHPSTALRPREEFKRLLRSFPSDRCLLAASARGAQR